MLLDAIAHIDELASGRGELAGRDETIVFDLIRLLGGRSAADLGVVRPELEKLATTAKKPLIRQVGYVALINVDGSVDKAWDLAAKSANSLARPALRDAADRRSERASKPVSEGGTAAGRPAGESASHGWQGRRRPLRPHRIGWQENAEPGRSRSLQQRPKHRPQRNGIAKRHSNTEARPTGPSTAIRTVRMASGTDHAHRRKYQQSLVASGSGRRVSHRTRSSFGIGRTMGWASDSTISLCVCGTGIVETFGGSDANPAPVRKAEFELGGGNSEVLFRQAAMDALTSVRGQETKTFQTLAKFVKDDNDRFAAIHAIQRIPRQFWPKEEAKPLVDVVLAAIKKIPTKERTTPEALDALEFADALAALLPADDGKKVRQELGELGVRVIRINTLPERMAYDKEMLVVKAGKPVEFLFENTDLMPHNFVIAQPGSMEELGKLAEATAQDPASAARQFVPKSPKVLLGSKLLAAARDAETELRRAERAGRLSLCLHLSRPLDADARRPLRRGGPGIVPGQSGGLPGQESGGDQGPAC